MLTSLAAIVGGVVALYVAFGGGDNSSNTPTTSNAALERWQSDAESICDVADKQVIGFPTPVVGDPAASDAWVKWLQKVIPIVKTSTNQLRALDEPAEAQADIDRLLDTMDKLTDSGDKMLRASRAFNFELMDTAGVELLGATDDMQTQMAELGLKDCLTFS